MKKSRCKGCGADIAWVRMRTGGNMPVDFESIKVVVVRKELHSDEAPGSMITAHNPHWATCPDAESFKKRSHDQTKEPDNRTPTIDRG